MHEKVLKPLRKNAKHIHNWWEFTGRPDPGEEAILETLKRLVSGVLTHPVTIGESVTVKQWKKERVWPFFGYCTADSETDAGRHHLYNNSSLVLFSTA